MLKAARHGKRGIAIGTQHGTGDPPVFGLSRAVPGSSLARQGWLIWRYPALTRHFAVGSVAGALDGRWLALGASLT